jgi:hypothetical protein
LWSTSADPSAIVVQVTLVRWRQLTINAIAV